MVVSYKKQWLGVTGSPSIANFSLQAPLPNRVNVGLNLTSDKKGLINTSSVLFTGGYTLPISLTQTFRFGFSAGLASTQVDIDALTFATAGDPALANIVKSNFQAIGNLGFSYHGQTLHAGIAIPSLFQPVFLTTNSFGTPQIKPLESLLAHASNRFYINKGKFIVEPYLVYRFNKTLPSQLEAATLFHMSNVLYLGASYKQNFGISALGGYRINKQMALGVSYSLQNIGTNTLSNPSFEIHLGYLFGKRHAKIPSYSFIDTELEKKPVKTALEIANEKRKVKSGLQKTNTAYEKNEPRYRNKSSDSIKTIVAAKPLLEKKQPVTQTKQQPAGKPSAKQTSTPVAAKQAPAALPAQPTLEQVIAHKQSQLNKGDTTSTAKVKITPTKRIILDSVSQHKEEQDRLKRLEVHAAEPLAEHNEDNHPHAERHEFAKRGNHSSEMDLGDYVIAGVFSTEANAKKYSDGLRKLGFKDTDYGYLTAHNHWYVHISESNDINTARADRDKFRKMKLFKESWLLTVHP
jgi:type IX secretion system PorP/SprF family membrane protein